MPLHFDKRDAIDDALNTPALRPEVGFGEAFDTASEAQHRNSNTDYLYYGLKREWDPIISDIEKRTGKKLWNPANALGFSDSQVDGGKSYYDQQVGVVNDFIRRNKQEFPELKEIDQQEVFQRVVTKAQAVGEEWATGSRYTTLAGSIGGFTGGAAAQITDPPTLAMTVIASRIPVVGPLWARVLQEGAINAGFNVLLEPDRRQAAQTLGIKRTFADFAAETGTSFLFGAAIPVAGKAVHAGVDYLRGLRSSPDPEVRAAATGRQRAYEATVEDNPAVVPATTTAPPPVPDVRGKANMAKAGPEWGNPDAPDYFQNHLTQIESHGKTVTVNKVAADAFKGFLDELQGMGYRIDSIGGYNDRNIAGTGKRSQHAFGNAIDINPGRNPVNGSTDLPPNVSDIAAKYGLSWGGDWKSKKDYMHFEFAGLPRQDIEGTHLSNYDTAMAAAATGSARPEPVPIMGKTRPPHIEGLEQVDPATVQVDAKTFQFKGGGDDAGVTERLKGVDKWEQDFAGVALVYERGDGTRYIADGHQRLSLAKRAQAEGQEAYLNARILKEADGWTTDSVRVRAAVKNIAEGTGSPLDAARILRAAREADLPPLPPTSALVRQGRALADLGDEPFMMVVNGVIPENYGAIVGRLVKDPKLQEAAIKVLNKTAPENAVQAETIVRQVADTEVATTTQSTLFGDEQITESLFGERAKVMDASLKALKKDKAVFSTLVNQASTIEGAGNVLSRETNLERMTQDAKVAEYIQRLASRKGPISDALMAAARSLRDGARPGDATRSFLSAVRRAVDDGVDGGSGGRSSGPLADRARPAEPAEIRAQQEFFEKNQDVLDEQYTKMAEDAFKSGELPKDKISLVNKLEMPESKTTLYEIENAQGQKLGDMLIAKDGDNAHVLNIQSLGGEGTPNSMGTSSVREVLRQYLDQNPEIQTISGERVTGARSKASSGNKDVKILARRGDPSLTKESISNEGVLTKDMEIYTEDANGNLFKTKVGDVLDNLKADERLVAELTDCVEGGAEVLA